MNEDLIYAFEALEELEKDVRTKKQNIDYRLCKQKYGFGTGDTIKLSDKWIEKEIREADDSFYRESIVNITTAKVLYISWNRNYVSLGINKWRREFYTGKDIKMLMEMQK